MLGLAQADGTRVLPVLWLFHFLASHIVIDPFKSLLELRWFLLAPQAPLLYPLLEEIDKFSLGKNEICFRLSGPLMATTPMSFFTVFDAF